MISLISDLRLDRHPQDGFCKESNLQKAYTYPIRPADSIGPRANDERRVVMASFVLCVRYVHTALLFRWPGFGHAHIMLYSIAMILRTPPMRWTPHMEDGLQYLSDNPETLDDERLVAIVKLSKVDEDVTAACPWRSFASTTTESTKVPPMMYVRGLRAQSEYIKQSLRAEILEDSKSSPGSKRTDDRAGSLTIRRVCPVVFVCDRIIDQQPAFLRHDEC